jgi:hypothetical protein
MRRNKLSHYLLSAKIRKIGDIFIFFVALLVVLLVIASFVIHCYSHGELPKRVRVFMRPSP